MDNENASQHLDKDDFTSSIPFMRALMTAFFVGIADTLLCLGYNLLYRHGSGGFFSSDIINVSSIIFGVNILFVLIGVLYFGFLKIGKGEMLFSALFILLTILGVIAAVHVHRSPDAAMNARFHGLLTGVVLIVGISAAGIPLLYHNRKFGEYVL